MTRKTTNRYFTTAEMAAVVEFNRVAPVVGLGEREASVDETAEHVAEAVKRAVR